MVIYGFFIYFQIFFKYKQLSKKFYTQMLKNYAVYNKMMQCQKSLILVAKIRHGHNIEIVL